MTHFESKDLLARQIATPTQNEISEIKYPCTGFCYFVIGEKEKLISKFLNKKEKDYYDVIKKLIELASERKKSDPEISEDGEFINEKTVKKYFPDIVNNTVYLERSLANDVMMDYFTAELYEILIKLPVMGYIIINRSQETFILFKIGLDNFLVIDSHQPFHGTVNYQTAMRYITRDYQSKGHIQIGYYHPYFM